MLAGTKSRILLLILLLLVIVTVVVAVAAVPLSTPMGGFWDDAQEFANTGHISSVFTPCGYPALLGLGFRAAGQNGIVVLQLVIYAVILAAIYGLLRVLGVGRTFSLAGAAGLGLHPELVISIKKIWDTNITTALLLVLCATLLSILRYGLTPARAALAGVVWGLSIDVRPNFPALIVPVAFAMWFAPVQGGRGRNLMVNGAATLLAAALAVVLVSVLVHGSFYVPQNGPYNFYAGDNEFTEMALMLALNAEPSIYPSLLADGFRPDVNVHSPELRSYYLEHGLLYIRHHPVQAAEFVWLKLETLLRADTKIYAPPALGGIVKVVLAMAIPLWGLILWASRRLAWGREDGLFLAFLVAYVAPFLLTNSDPRFRIPLDVLLLTHGIYRIAKLYGVQLLNWQRN
jgi:hypothetical protein